MIRHNADPHVTFFGVQQGINFYVVRNAKVSTGSAWGTYEGVTAYLRYSSQLPDTPKCSSHQRFWWEIRDVHTGELIHTPPTARPAGSSQTLSAPTARSGRKAPQYPRSLKPRPRGCGARRRTEKTLTDDKTTPAPGASDGTDSAPEDWSCACAMRNPGDSEDCRGCHLTRAGQGAPMPPCTCGCDPSPGRYGEYDAESSASRQHFIDTGRYLRHGEILDMS